MLKGLLVIEPEKRFSLDLIAKHPWTSASKGRDNPTTAKLLDVIATRGEVKKTTTVKVRSVTPFQEHASKQCYRSTVKSWLSSF